MMNTQKDSANGYLHYFGLLTHPFPVAPDDENFYFSEHINQIIAEIVHGVESRKGFMVLTGDIGLGKTTISRRIIAMLEAEGTATALVFHTALQDAELLRQINRDFGLLGQDGNLSDTPILSAEMARLNDFLLSQNRQQKNCTIVIDDAQNLSAESLELVRMISNLEAGQQKLVQILLVGQPELMQRLNSHELRQLKSRIIIQKEVRPLGREELKNYIHFKLNMAGSSGAISLTRGAFGRIHRLTRGNFRAVNRLMDRTLYVACLKNRQTIDRHMLGLAHADLTVGDGPHRRPWKMALAAALCLGLLVSGGYWLKDRWLSAIPAVAASFQANRPDDQAAAVAPQPSAPISAVVNAAASEKAAPGLAAASAAAAPAQVPVTVPPAVKAFLSNSDLGRFAAAFSGALVEGDMDSLAKAIYTQTGLQLVQLDHLPGAVRRRHGVLTYPVGPEGQVRHFVLWRPRLEFRKFYYYYVGTEVLALQKWLAHVGFYNDKLDSIVGARLMKGVVDFQRSQGLPVTGFPDAATLFLLSGLQEGPSDG
ncbi:MAG: AAA family ATPase [Desulfosarcinaceae bacterium]